ncbi:uncharacterized protein MELLADRAFT_104475 [Melampsora larici-populina 98AG31]|uniref:hydroxyethylthiazole kinase n=1 Tax=Melampsora larici-populina (strain 98AG31 / pathotype 3-4-7) TaxID=747676 RepID=F4REU2_MELLP|nr:uncharacterized protein MELLADRAFT_104475 [Melampsora larici-populina 98AG31]EGG09163.1 hypothetical protein MELLADRAFT_104475 [Melampsora larici-populina 98AG31]
MSSDQPQIEARRLRQTLDKHNIALESFSSRKSKSSILSSQGSESYSEYLSSVISFKCSHHCRQLIHHITNTVVQNNCANLTLSLRNLTLALRCSPMMSSSIEEVEESVQAIFCIDDHDGSFCLFVGIMPPMLCYAIPTIVAVCASGLCSSSCLPLLQTE